MCKLIFVYIILLVASIGTGNGEPIYVKLREGVVHGVAVSSDAGISYRVFKGIPYAKAPIGAHRFKAPQPYGQIKGSFQANKDGAACPQLDPVSGKYIGDEDCLKLNVFLPEYHEDRANRKYPVLVFIHGGSFQYGSDSTETYKPFKFLEREIIVVTFNYRLGALGFLSTLDNITPGNFGLLDQVEALRWIQQNIGAFGGDVNQITLFGHDAGAASALFHLLSPLSKGLFHQVIALSGSPVCDTSLQKDPVKWATELGIKLDCYIASSQTLIDCLRKRLPDEIVAKSLELHDSGYPPVFLPVVERIHKDNGDFLPDTPVNLLKEFRTNRAPVILGVNKNEGVQFFRRVLKNNLSTPEIFFDETLPNILKTSTAFKHNIKDISSALRKDYYSKINVDDEVQFENATQELLADLLLRRCNDLTAKYLSEAGWPTYMYVTEHSLSDDSFAQDILYPDDLKYLFIPNDHHDLESDQQTKAKRQRILLSTWSNFAKTSMPTPTKSHDVPLTWIPMNPGKIRYLKVDAIPEIIDGYLTARMKFWNVILPKLEVGGKKDEL